MQQHRQEEKEEEEREGEPRGAGGALRSRRRRPGEESRHGSMEPQDYLQPRSVRGPSSASDIYLQLLISLQRPAALTSLLLVVFYGDFLGDLLQSGAANLE